MIHLSCQDRDGDNMEEGPASRSVYHMVPRVLKCLVLGACVCLIVPSAQVDYLVHHASTGSQLETSSEYLGSSCFCHW